MCRVKSTRTKIPGKEFLQSIRNLKFGIPQRWTEFLFQSFHKLFKLLCTNLWKQETEMLSTSISQSGKRPSTFKVFMENSSRNNWFWITKSETVQQTRECIKKALWRMCLLIYLTVAGSVCNQAHSYKQPTMNTLKTITLDNSLRSLARALFKLPLKSFFPLHTLQVLSCSPLSLFVQPWLGGHLLHKRNSPVSLWKQDFICFQRLTLCP